MMGAMQRPWISIPATRQCAIHHAYVCLCAVMLAGQTQPTAPPSATLIQATPGVLRQSAGSHWSLGVVGILCAWQAPYHAPRGRTSRAGRACSGGVDAIAQLVAVDPDLGEARGAARGRRPARVAQVLRDGHAQVAVRTHRQTACLRGRVEVMGTASAFEGRE